MSKILFELERGSLGVFRILEGNYKDKNYIDIRMFERDAKTLELIPTRKGVVLPASLAPELANALLKVEVKNEQEAN